MTIDTETAPKGNATPFSLHAAAYQAAVQMYDRHCDTHKPASEEDPIWGAYESSYSELVMAMRATAIAAIGAPASSADEVREKLAIYIGQELEMSSDSDEILTMTRAFADDAIRFAGGAA